MGILDRTKSVTTQQSLTENVQRNVNVQDSAGAIALTDNSGNVQILQTDFNAIGRATDLAELTVEASERMGRDAIGLGYDTAQLVTDYADREASRASNLALDFGSLNSDVASRAIDAADESRADFAGLASDFVAQFSEQGSDFFQASLAFARESSSKFQSTIASTVDALQRIGVEQNKSTDQRLAETSEKMTKYALIAIGVLGISLVAMSALRR